MAEQRRPPKSIRFSEELENKILKQASKTKLSFHGLIIKIIEDYFKSQSKTK